MELTFKEATPRGPQPAGDVGGDYQTSEAYSRRFIAPLADGTYASVTAYFYVEDVSTIDPPHKDGSIVLSRQIEYTVCTDPGDVGGTEINSDVRYVTLERGTRMTDADARKACRRLKLSDVSWPSDLERMLPAETFTKEDLRRELVGRAQIRSMTADRRGGEMPTTNWIRELTARDDFPEPVGPAVWLRSEVAAYLATPRKPGPKPREAS